MKIELGSMCKSRFWPNVSFPHSPEVIEESRNKAEVNMSYLLVEMCVGYLQIKKDCCHLERDVSSPAVLC